MAGSTWVQDKIELYEGELVVFKRANSPNWYMRIYIQKELRHFQKSLRTHNVHAATEKAKAIFKELQQTIARDEKVFSIDLQSAIQAYYDAEKARYRMGIIKEDWLLKKHAYLSNTFMPFIGNAKIVNTITDKQIEEFVDQRLQTCKKKQTVQQEITIIKHFYASYLIKKGYVFRAPEFPRFKLGKGDLSRRGDTFSEEEYNKLIRFIDKQWIVYPTSETYATCPRIRHAVKQYGNKENKEKRLNQLEWDMELHRRQLIKYAILIAANSGIRLPQELFSLRWRDIECKHSKKFLDKESIRLPQEYFIQEYGIGEPAKWSGIPGWECELAIIHMREEYSKTGERRIPTVLGSVFRSLSSYYYEMYEHYELDFKLPDQNPDMPVFMELFGRRKSQEFDKYAFNRMWRELMNDAGLNRIHFTPYHLRHYFITERIRAGTPVPQLAKLCGNSPNIIYSTYEHIFLEDDVAALFRKEK